MSVLQRNAVTVTGRGEKPMIFLHGFGCDQTMWRYISPHFEDSHRVILYDHVGSGQSDLTAYDLIKYNSLHGYADDLIEIAETLDLKSADLTGHSVGSMIAILAACKRPDLFDRQLLLGPSPRYIDTADYTGGFNQKGIDELLAFLQLNQAAWAKTMAPMVMGNADRPELASELEFYFRANNPDIVHHFAKVIYNSDHRADLAALRNRALIMQCADDIVVPVEVGEYMRRQIPNSRLVVLNTEGHYPQFSHPQVVRQAMCDYLHDYLHDDRIAA